MSSPSDVRVALDDRIRLFSALLAATGWTQQQAHGSHAHVRATHKRLAGFRDHDAARILKHFLDRGAPLDALFMLATRLTWPELEPVDWPPWAPAQWPDSLRDFYARADLETWWRQEDAPWQKSLAESRRMFAQAQIGPFLRPFLGDLRERFIFMPNIGEPSHQDIGLRFGRDLVALVPPRPAWGESAPWPFDDDPPHVYRAALMQWGRLLLLPYLRRHDDLIAEASKTPLPVSDDYRERYPRWEDQFIHLSLSGLVAIYLEDHISPAEANAYVLVERKVHGMGMLPSVVSVLRRYLAEQGAGHYAELADLLPGFSKQLRVAKRIVNL
jgi:hypothetical protein